jgi:hypothetical protein
MIALSDLASAVRPKSIVLLVVTAGKTFSVVFLTAVNTQFLVMAARPQSTKRHRSVIVVPAQLLAVLLGRKSFLPLRMGISNSGYLPTQSRASWGRITFRTRVDNHKVQANWSYSIDGAQTPDLQGRKVGDIHFAPSITPKKDYDYWVYVEVPSDGIWMWLAQKPGRPHPIWREHVLKGAKGNRAPRWVLPRSYRM